MHIDKLYHRANPPARFILIARFTLEPECFVCDHATTIENQKLQSKGVAMHMYSVSVYYLCTGSILIGLGRSHEMKAKIERLSNFNLDNGSSMPKKLKR